MTGAQRVVLGIVGDPQPHQAALARLYRGDRLVVERRPPRRERSAAELDAIADRIVADEPDLAAAGLHRGWMDWAPERGVVEVDVVGGRDEHAVAEFFAARYGDVVAVRWLGPNRFREEPLPFGSWTPDGRRIRVFFAVGANGQQPGRARVLRETDELILIALTYLDPVGFQTLKGGFDPHHADLELHEAVGRRAVIDASSRGRPSRWPSCAGDYTHTGRVPATWSRLWVLL